MIRRTRIMSRQIAESLLPVLQKVFTGVEFKIEDGLATSITHDAFEEWKDRRIFEFSVEYCEGRSDGLRNKPTRDRASAGYLCGWGDGNIFRFSGKKSMIVYI
jgi:hypothetical protein